MALIVFIARVTLGCVFVLSALGKLRAHSQIASDVMQYQLVPPSTARTVGWTLLSIEGALGLLLIYGAYISLAAGAGFALLLLFTAGIVINLRRGRRFPCRCFGTSEMNIGMATAMRNIILMILAGSTAVANAISVGAYSQTLLWKDTALSSGGIQWAFELGGIVVFAVASSFLWHEFEAFNRRRATIERGRSAVSKSRSE